MSELWNQSPTSKMSCLWEESVTIVVKTTTTKPFADLIEDPTVDEMEGEDYTMKLNKMMKAKMTGHFH